MNKFVSTVKITLALVIVGAVRLFGIKWNPYTAGAPDALAEKEEVE
jgi:hypothetical protein